MRNATLGKLRDAVLLLAIAAVFVAVVRPAIVTAQGANAGQLCISNIQQLDLAVGLYTQDYDATLPPLTSRTQLAKAVQPYTSTSVAYLLQCPLTQMAYTLNTSVSGKSLFSLPNRGAATIFAQDYIPHTDGKSTISYVGGIVTYGGVIPFTPDTMCFGNAKNVGVATIGYTQDYDERLPVYHTYADYQTALGPYAQNTNVFTCPDTRLPYVVNKSLSGKMLIQIPSPAATKLLQDARPHPNGKITTVFLDGHGVQPGQ